MKKTPHKKTLRKMFLSTFVMVMVIGLISFMYAVVSGAEGTSASLKPVEYNQKQLVIMAVQGFIAPPGFSEPPYDIDPQGKIHVLPGIGSITYNFRTGDSAVHIAGDHIEPAVSLYNPGRNGGGSSYESRGLNGLSCIGNKVLVLTGEAKGAEGRVVGKHGGAEHVMVDFPDDVVFKKLAIEDKMRVYAIGVGMELKNIRGVKAINMSPHLLEALTKAGMGVTGKGKLRISVTHSIPAKIMGSGLGRSHVYRGDYDIQLFDKKTVKEHNLETLRFGDIVAIIDADHTYGRIYQEGAVSVGVITHSRSSVAGHGPGVTTLLTSREGNIEVVIDPDANLSKLLNIR
ncbi:hypothetical protein LCGC14_0768440 [marine sediment metagenome]|uniref:DUF4438 domain-containing protein n=1 Tax=marine sediment metagenome TaxID=412755 RepID=A0A0F9SJ34_9ZZZZ